ncbi:MAG: hypothetical protein FD180_321 [Planctomycetota bacterium]|nr:MAG: hypothetical protein FD180_321 [Planctomycetota bacterium]
MVHIRGLPVDTTFLTIITESGGAPRIMGRWDRSGGGMDWKWVLVEQCAGDHDYLVFSGDGLNLSTRYFAWRDAPRYGVLRRDLRGRWSLLWVVSAEVSNENTASSAPLGRKTIPYPASATTEIPTTAFLQSVGISWCLPGSAEAEKALSAPDEKCWGDRALSGPARFLPLILEIRRECENEVNWESACSNANRICFQAPVVFGQAVSLSPDQLTAIEQLGASYDAFVAALTRSPQEANLLLDRWETHLRFLIGN